MISSDQLAVNICRQRGADDRREMVSSVTFHSLPCIEAMDKANLPTYDTSDGRSPAMWIKSVYRFCGPFPGSPTSFARSRKTASG